MESIEWSNERLLGVGSSVLGIIASIIGIAAALKSRGSGSARRSRDYDDRDYDDRPRRGRRYESRPAQKPKAGCAKSCLSCLFVIGGVFAVLVGIGFFSGVIFNYVDQEKESRARSQINRIEIGLMEYKVRNQVFPPDLQSLTTSEGLSGAAVLNVSDITDPWGKSYQYSPWELNGLGKPRISTTTPGGHVIENW